jgi:hypothetical protein
LTLKKGKGDESRERKKGKGDERLVVMRHTAA